MMNLRKLIALFFIGGCVLAAISCQKEQLNKTTTDAAIDFELKEYYPGSGKAATARVKEFISYTALSPEKSLGTATNVDPNEGVWLMEATTNYAAARSSGSTNNPSSVHKFTTSVANVVEADGQVKMDGASLSTQFDILHDVIQDYAAAQGEVVVLSDFDITNVTNSSTSISAHVALGPDKLSVGIPGIPVIYPCNTTEYTSAGEAALVIASCINEENGNQGWISNAYSIFCSGPIYSEPHVFPIPNSEFEYITVSNIVGFNGLLYTNTQAEAECGCTDCLHLNYADDSSDNEFSPSKYEHYIDGAKQIIECKEDLEFAGQQIQREFVAIDMELDHGNPHPETNRYVYSHFISAIYYGIHNNY